MQIAESFHKQGSELALSSPSLFSTHSLSGSMDFHRACVSLLGSETERREVDVVGDQCRGAVVG